MRARIAGAFMATLVVFFTTQASGQSASSIGDAAATLAKQFIERKQTDNRLTIGVTSFPHVDDSCSELSNIFHDELVFQIFEVGDGDVGVVERAQLAQIFAELEFQRGGDVDLNTAKEVGRILGVDSIIIGSLARIGEKIRINARLLTTETGKVTSVARTDFPVTDTVKRLMESPSAGSCGFGTVKSSRKSRGPSRLEEAIAVYSTDSFRVAVIQASMSEDNNTVTFVLRFENTSDSQIGISYVEDSASVIANKGYIYEMGETWSGLRVCGWSAYSKCSAEHPNRATLIKPDKYAQLIFNVRGEKSVSANSFSISMELILTPDASTPDNWSVVSVGLFDVLAEK